MLGDVDRARAIFELAIAQQEMEMPELVWKRYIEFETEEEEYERARKLVRNPSGEDGSRQGLDLICHV